MNASSAARIDSGAGREFVRSSVADAVPFAAGPRPLALPFRSIADMIRRNAARYAGRPALRYRREGEWTTLTYEKLYERALRVARGLAKLGVRKGDRVAILSENRAGWVIADLGIACAGAISVPIYPSSTPEQVAHVVEHSGATVAFVSTCAQYAKLVMARGRLPRLGAAVCLDRFLGDAALPLFTFPQLCELDVPITAAERDRIEAAMERLVPDDRLTIIYTSGTTGVPKGVALTHRNVLYEVAYGRRMVPQFGDREVLLSCLPLSHVLERAVGYYMTLAHGCLMAFADSIEKVPENLREVRPTAMVGVPRLFEKIHARIMCEVARASAPKRGLFAWAMNVARAHVRARVRGERPGAWLSMRHELADRLVFSKLRERFGGKLRVFISGGAPLDPAIAEFFWAIGLPLLEGYGLTETTAAITINTFEATRFGSVGRPLEHTEIKTAPDGEILVRGPGVMACYERDPAATREAFDDDGWFCTGDVGRIEDGFVFITDRKKELIVTAGGKNIAPQAVETELKKDEYVAQAFVHGDRRPYLTALLVPSLERLAEWARGEGIAHADVEELLAHEAVRRFLSARIEAVNARLARHEQVKRFALLPREFSVEGGELSPSLKLRRRIIQEKYRDRIDGLY